MGSDPGSPGGSCDVGKTIANAFASSDCLRPLNKQRNEMHPRVAFGSHRNISFCGALLTFYIPLRGSNTLVCSFLDLRDYMIERSAA